MIMTELDVSWTQDEWTEFLAKECRIRRDNASQIASKLAEQDFQTGKFGSFISEWQNNWEGCKGILMENGFKSMDIVSFIAALRRHIEKQDKRANVDNTQKRPMCNELVSEVCKDIAVVKTSDRILLTSANIYAYLEKPFRKKLIYWDAISFLKTNDWSKFSIAIELNQNIGSEIVVVNQKQKCELWTNRLHIHLSLSEDTKFVISEECFGNSHVHFFLQLIGHQLRPISVDLTEFDDSTFSSAACFLNKMHDSIDWVQLSAEHFHLKPTSAALSMCNKLAIYSWTCMDDVQMRQFCDAFIRWINANNGGQPKMCVIHFRHKTLRVLDAVKKDFVGATHKQPFIIRIEHYGKPPWDEFTVSNARTRERLQLRQTGESHYVLYRQSTREFDYYKHKQLEWEFENVHEMDSITLKCSE